MERQLKRMHPLFGLLLDNNLMKIEEDRIKINWERVNELFPEKFQYPVSQKVKKFLRMLDGMDLYSIQRYYWSRIKSRADAHYNRIWERVRIAKEGTSILEELRRRGYVEIRGFGRDKKVFIGKKLKEIMEYVGYNFLRRDRPTFVKKLIEMEGEHPFPVEHTLMHIIGEGEMEKVLEELEGLLEEAKKRWQPLEKMKEEYLNTHEETDVYLSPAPSIAGMNKTERALAYFIELGKALEEGKIHYTSILDTVRNVDLKRLKKLLIEELGIGKDRLGPSNLLFILLHSLKDAIESSHIDHAHVIAFETRRCPVCGGNINMSKEKTYCTSCKREFDRKKAKRSAGIPVSSFPHLLEYKRLFGDISRNKPHLSPLVIIRRGDTAEAVPNPYHPLVRSLQRIS